MRPTEKRLSRIEDLLIEIRNEQDVKHKKLATLQRRMEELAEQVMRKIR